MFFGPESAEDEQADRDLRKGLSEGSAETLRAFALLAVLIQAAVFAVASERCSSGSAANDWSAAR
ncbi:hypothetical protein [Halorussus sp. MSC15.2]|uniref:hypothetical protein n=1 Tax=Halorussus sp. MSC15.2 TaxID=2283638 RepID=UPI0013CF5BDA|nr:hypothetical protein [Halorussus sp. MSC15.2]NEU58450.1 hypothetical protein [Halorussus sp. MSC15.2]